MALWLGGVAGAQGDAPRVDLTGCLVTEREFTRAFGVTAGTVVDVGDGLVILVDAAAGPSGRAQAYALTGLVEPELSTHVGRRIRLSGQAEGAASSGAGLRPAGRTEVAGKPPAGAVGVTPDGSPAHEPGDALAVPEDPSATRKPRDGTPPATLLDLPRVRVTTYAVQEGRCGVPDPPRLATTGAPSAQTPVPGPGDFNVPGQPVRVFGCVVPNDAAGGSREGLLLVDAVVTAAGTGGAAGAVPGSPPAGSGSGTVGTAGTDARTASVAQPQGFVLTGEVGSLGTHLGKRVEITGTIVPLETAPGSPAPAAAPRESAAHPSAPERALRVSGFRPTAGACR